MELFVLGFVVTAGAFGAMAIGVLLGRAPLRRGCDAAGALGCERCARPCPAARRARARQDGAR